MKFCTQKHQGKDKDRLNFDSCFILLWVLVPLWLSNGCVFNPEWLYLKWFPLNILRNVQLMLTKFCTRSTRAWRRPSSNRVTLTFFRGHRGHVRQRDMKDGFCSIPDELLDVPSPNLVHRGTRARLSPSSNRVTLTLFLGPRSLGQQDMKDGFR